MSKIIAVFLIGKKIPELNHIEKKRTIRVLAYNFNQKQQSLIKKINHIEIPSPIIRNNPLPDLGTTLPLSLPKLYIINSEGKLINTLNGSQPEQSIHDYVP